MQQLDVLVADNHPIFAAGIQAVLSDPGEGFTFNIKGVAKTGAEARDLLLQNNPDLLLLDLSLPDMGGLQFLPSLKREHANTRILVMATTEGQNLAQAVFEAGADGFMLKSGTKAELLALIGKVINGETNWNPNKYAASPQKLPNHRQAFADKHGLTHREMEILPLIGKAMDNFDIGAQLYISHQTVSVHRKNIMRKLKVNSTANLIKIAFENNLV